MKDKYKTKKGSDSKDYIKQFLAGAIPAMIIFTLAILGSYFYPLLYRVTAVWWMILLVGAVNVFYFWMLHNKHCPIEDWNVRMHGIGAGIGIITALSLIFMHQLFDFVDITIRLLTFAIMGALIWRYAVHYLNLKFGQIE